ncbi:MAG: FG-GAP repeat domain-containing protein [Candidatus Sulfotelmatobacter sp.]
MILTMMFSLLVGSAVGQNLGAVCPGWSVTNDVRMAIDLNRDGKADLAAFDNADKFNNHSALWTAINTGSGVFNVQKALQNLDAANAGDPTKHVRMLVDLNGDHVPDIVIFGDAGVWTSLSQQNPRVSPQVTAATPANGINPVPVPTVFATPTLVLPNFGVQQGWDPQKHVRLVVDVNHDGYADIVGFGDAGVWVALGNGDGTFQTPNLVVPNFGANQGWSPAKHVRLLADLNHDGYPDIVAFGDQGVFTAMNKGDRSGTFNSVQAGLTPQNFGSNQGWSVAKHVRLTAVLNTVGYADIIGFGDQGVWTALGNGDGTFQAPKLVLANFGVAQGWDPAKHVRLMADLNHNGRDDIVAFGDAGVWTAMSAAYETVKLNASPGPHGNIPVAEPGAGTFDTPRLVLENFGVKQEWSPAKHIRVMADLNADNFPDIVGFGDGGVWTALGNGDGTFQTAQFPLDYFACKGKFDFNVESTETDLNGFPLNPQWRWQLYHPESNPPNPTTDTPQAAMCHYFSATDVVNTGQTSIQVLVPSYSDCTDQMTHVNAPDGWNALVCSTNPRSGFDGHLDWFTATFGTMAGSPPPSIGSFSFGDHNGWDDDYDNSMYMAYDISSHIFSGFPAMMNGRDSQHVEFDSDETIDYFATPWWNQFHHAVDNGGASSMLHDTESIVTGMFGVDCEHDGCKSEIHPVFTVALHVLDSPDNDTWAMFLRNTGDEGYCSSQIETANFTTYTFRLPWRTKESTPWTAVDVLWGPTYPDCAQAQEAQAKSCFEQQVPPGGATGPTITYLSGQWVDVTFTFPAPTKRPLIDGELHLQWRGQSSNGALTASSPASTPSTGNSSPANSHEEQEKEDESGPLGIALGKLSPAQQSQIKKTVAAATASGAKMQALPAGQPAREVTASEAPAPHAVVHIGTAGPAATEKAARDATMIRELCKAYGGSIEGAPANTCAQASH